MEIRAQVAEYLTSRIHALRFQQTHLQHSSTTTTTTTTSSSSSSDPNLEKLPPVPSAIPTTEESDTAADSPPSEQVSTVPGGYQNISALRANTMKFFPNFFARGQLSKIFICFPDPHFKTRKHKARIVSESLNAEYAYSLRPGGLLYTITDVEEYHYWILRHFKQDDAEGPPGGSGDATAPAASGTVEKLPGVEELFERLTEEELRLDECVRVMMDSTEEGKKVTRNKGNKYVAVFRRKADPEWPLDDDDDNGCI
ncbi:hypothetical protein ARAM_000161 [Aspergillus rambellii]|uniref:tRNA (guanine(46)-N(7))-methyltransferase n=1 Tax=Aspergillus rambellii TaxID=308745 RepID=A0A0F8UM42_9EURO|nr:hypothetical protein ARAM_000161 [Aspergillus rambellii]